MAPTSEEHELQTEQVLFISILIPPLFKLLTEPSVVNSSNPGVPLQTYIPNSKVSICLNLSHCKFILIRTGLPKVSSPWAQYFQQVLLAL